MKSPLAFLFAFLALQTSIAQKPANFESLLSEIAARMDTLEYFAGSFPPNVQDLFQLNNIVTLFHSIEDDLESLVTQYPGSARLRLSLGELYRMGHNLDIEGAWDKAEENLKKAIDLDSESPQAYFTLGLLYVNSDIGLAPTAEELLHTAIQHSGGHPDPYIYQCLAIAHF